VENEIEDNNHRIGFRKQGKAVQRMTIQPAALAYTYPASTGSPSRRAAYRVHYSTARTGAIGI